MKKFLLFLLPVFFLFPSAASANEAEIILKAGITPVSSLETDMEWRDYYGYYNWDSSNSGADTGFQGALEFFYYVAPFIGVGAGVNEQFSRNIHKMGDVSYTSVYLAIKPRMSLSDDEAQGLYGYLIGNIGFSFVNQDFKINGRSLDVSNGAYFGFGAGLQFYNFLAELVYSVNSSSVYSNHYNDYYYDSSYQYYSALYINLGYRFRIK